MLAINILIHRYLSVQIHLLHRILYATDNKALAITFKPKLTVVFGPLTKSLVDRGLGVHGAGHVLRLIKLL